jgi:hypothetical protein
VVRLNVVSVFFTRIIALYEGLGGSLEGGFRRFCLRAISHLMKSCLMRLVRLKKRFFCFFCLRALSRFMTSCLTRVVRLKAVSVAFVVRIITFYVELFVEGGSLECGFCRFSRALSRLIMSCLTHEGGSQQHSLFLKPLARARSQENPKQTVIRMLRCTHA